jgi:FlaA1/EpsC-like NDP-sugar epimerase
MENLIKYKMKKIFNIDFFAKRFGDVKILQSWVVLVIDMLLSLLATIISVLIVDLFVDYTISFKIIGICFSVSIVSSIIPFLLLHTYRKVIRHSGLKDILLLGYASLFKSALFFIITFFLSYKIGTLNDLIFNCMVDFFLTFMFLVVFRASALSVYDRLRAELVKNINGDNVLIYGIGIKSVALLNFFNKSQFYNVAGFLAYDSKEKYLKIEQYNVYCFTKKEDLNGILTKKNVRYVIFPTYSDLLNEKNRLVLYAQQNGVKMLISPNIDQVNPNNGVLKLGIREIKIEDLLGRDEIQIDMDRITDNFSGKTVLVTGAAGSIGSEICRQLIKTHIKKLIMLDAAETPLHNLRLNMEDKYGGTVEFVPIIADVRLLSRLDFIFNKHRPDIVFHAAAYKHVPLMEENPCEAVFVNVVGTKNVADISEKYNVGKFIMISTDKAVNPTNVMGATKRVAEMYVQSMTGKTKFTTTRFGNVLGSNGSVIPRFREQIEKGGPLTVTSEEINRFFMSIPEACRLVLEAATIGVGGDILVFDMGEPVKIIDLATKMIELAGYRPGEDIKIKITGLRPGEKLFEEVLNDLETTLPTSNKKIRIAKVRESDNLSVSKQIEEFDKLVRKVEIPETIALLKKMVPEFIHE